MAVEHDGGAVLAGQTFGALPDRGCRVSIECCADRTDAVGGCDQQAAGAVGGSPGHRCGSVDSRPPHAERKLPADGTVYRVNQQALIAGDDNCLLAAALLNDRWRRVAGWLVSGLPANLAG